MVCTNYCVVVRTLFVLVVTKISKPTRQTKVSCLLFCYLTKIITTMEPDEHNYCRDAKSTDTSRQKKSGTLYKLADVVYKYST